VEFPVAASTGLPESGYVSERSCTRARDFLRMRRIEDGIEKRDSNRLTR
jgi:hypothetical protein